MRRPIVAGNWKMHGTLAEAVELASGVREVLGGFTGAEVVLCPPFTAGGDADRNVNIPHPRLLPPTSSPDRCTPTVHGMTCFAGIISPTVLYETTFPSRVCGLICWQYPPSQSNHVPGRQGAFGLFTISQRSSIPSAFLTSQYNRRQTDLDVP